MSTGKKITLANAQLVLGTATSQVVIALTQAIVDRQAAAGLNQIRKALDAGTDPRQFARQMVDYLRNLLLIRLGSGDQVDATPDQRSQMAQHAQAFDTPWLMETLRTFNAAAVDQRSTWQPGLALELAFAGSIEWPGQGVIASPPPPLDQTRLTGGSAPGESTPPPRAAAPPTPETGRTRSVHEPAAPASKAADTTTEAAKTSTASPSPVQKPAAGPGVSMQTIQQNWARIRALVKKRKSMTEALLNSCKLMGVKEGILILGFKGEVIKSKMEANDNLKIIREAIQEVTGGDLQVTCVISTGKGSAIPADLNVDNDGMVSTALRDLGGEIVDVK
jgi:DNA polymerase-3 subunit gamma/tau